jgi:predicted nucleic acid-binding protein
MPTFFLDTSALLKLYHQEIGTERVEEIFQQTENTLVISELAVVEFYSSLARRVRMKEVTPEAQAEAIQNLDEDCSQRFVIEPLGSVVLQQAKNLLRKHGNSKSLRSLDALQLAGGLVVARRGELTFVSADSRLVDIAQLEGLLTLNPESSSIVAS